MTSQISSTPQKFASISQKVEAAQGQKAIENYYGKKAAAS
jgi:hypothetical protein